MTAPRTPMTDIVIRRAYPDDRPALERLAALDSAAAPAGPALLVEQGGELQAALDLQRGAVIADPFRPTEHLVALLRLQAGGSPTPRRTGRSRAGAMLRAVLGPTTPLDHRAA